MILGIGLMTVLQGLSMNTRERRQQILELVQVNRSVTNEDLQQEFNVTKETIRKDLNVLSESGNIIRTFGGAIFREEYDPSFEQRRTSNLDEKRQIAKEAAKLIEANDIIALDSSSTTFELANLLTREKELVVLTNSLKVLNVLAKLHTVTAISTGGILRNRSLSFQGEAARNTIDTYNIRKAFISAKALDIEKGIMDSNEGEAAVKRIMLEKAQDVTLLVDHAKLDHMAHVTVCPVSRINRIITSTLADAQTMEKFRQAGIDVRIVAFPPMENNGYNR